MKVCGRTLALRPFSMADADDVLRLRNQDHVRAGMLHDTLVQPSDHLIWMEKTIAADDKSYFVVTLDDEPVGVIGFYAQNPRTRTAEWSFYFTGARPAGVKGLATRALLLAQRHFFEVMGRRRIYSQVLVTNEGSLRVHRTLGFSREAVLRGHAMVGDVPTDVIGLGLLDSEWPQVRDALWAQMFDPPGLP